MHSFTSAVKTHLGLACTTLLIAAIPALQAQNVVGADRPASVPEGYVITPMGYFHPSCVQEVAEGDVVRSDEKAIEHKDGSFDPIRACAYPRFTPSGEMVSENRAGPKTGPADASLESEAAPPPGIAHAYISLAQMIKSSGYYGEIRANWTVPAAPTSHDNQTVFFFPGLEDHDSPKTTILQPVLGWNAAPAVKNVWSMASWNCCVDGTVQHSAFVPTASGHTIFGQVSLKCTPGSKVCSRFQVNTVDQTTGKSTLLPMTSSFGLNFNWAFAGALEVYSVSKCSDYPPGGSTQFYFLGLFDQNLQPVSQHYTGRKLWTGKPQCNYAVTEGQKSGLPAVTLTY